MEDGALAAFLLLTAILLSVARLRRADATFAAGFMPYRADDRWPAGVQEEYDVSWRLPVRRSPGNESQARIPPVAVARTRPTLRPAR